VRAVVWMAWKCAVADIAGWQRWFAVDPATSRSTSKKNGARPDDQSYAIGPRQDVPAPDVAPTRDGL
jgi:hypothetical protein